MQEILYNCSYALLCIYFTSFIYVIGVTIYQTYVEGWEKVHHHITKYNFSRWQEFIGISTYELHKGETNSSR